MTEAEAIAIYASGEQAVVVTLLALDAKFRKLEEQQALNSRNSSKPPSVE